ncbi:MAG TPA: hypothetical protein VF546_13950 [Pyrinomonadaceae bacterium]|jgi:hypothetical protein
MKAIPFVLVALVALLRLPPARRWLAVARGVCVEARAAYARGGWKAAAFEVEMRARALYALALAAPVIFQELVALTHVVEGWRAAWRAGLAPETYARRRCEALGIRIGSPTYLGILSFLWSLRDHWEQQDGGR